MKKILRSHPNIIIGALAFLFAATLIGFYWWAMNDIFTELHVALAPPTPMTVTGFDLSAAAQLGLPGFATSSPSAATSTP